MDFVTSSILLLVLLICFLASGMWIFSGILLTSVAGLSLFLGYPLERIGIIMVKRVCGGAGSWEIACIPMFMWMAELMSQTDISKRLFRGVAPLVDKLPGRLIHTNVAGCVVFAAVSGSTVATTATIGRMTVPELIKRNYDTNLSIGSLAGAGSFGIMIPPSVIFIVYGVLTEQSIARLFLAGVFPGLLLAGLYSLYISVRCLINPKLAPGAGQKYSFKEYLNCFVLLLPVIIIMGVVMGSIYSGIATPAESAAFGLATACVITICMRQFSWKIFSNSLMQALKSSCMVVSLMAAASFLSTAMGFLNIPQNLSHYIGTLGLSPYELLMALTVFYIILGMLLDGVSMTVMSIPICYPLIIQAGFDPIWFAVFFVIMVELAAITPPVGFNLFVLQSMSGYPIGKTAVAAFPFFLLMLIGALIITAFPKIALWLPSILMAGK